MTPLAGRCACGRRRAARNIWPTCRKMERRAQWGIGWQCEATSRGRCSGRSTKEGGWSCAVCPRQAIYNMLVKRAEQASVSHFSPHDLRRTLAGDLLDAGADIVTVQKILAHANVQTTARYDRRPEQTKRKAASLI